VCSSDLLETARIDHDIGTAANLAFAVMTVASQAREVGHQRRARTRQAIEQSGLANVGSTDQSHNGLKRNAFQLIPTKTKLPLPVWTRTPRGVPTKGDTMAPPPTLTRPSKVPSSRDRK